MIHRYVWRVELPTSWNVDQLKDALYKPLQRVQGMNRWVQAAELILYDDHVLVAMAMAGHDRWWVRKRAPKLIAAVITQAQVDLELVSHQDVETPLNLKSARFLTSDGKRVFVPEDGDPGPPLEELKQWRPCVKCKEPKHFTGAMGWHSGQGAYRGRGR